MGKKKYLAPLLPNNDKRVEFDPFDEKARYVDADGNVVKWVDWLGGDGVPCDHKLSELGCEIVPAFEYTENQLDIIAALRAREPKAFAEDKQSASDYRQKMGVKDPSLLLWYDATHDVFEAAFAADTPVTEINWPKLEEGTAPEPEPTPDPEPVAVDEPEPDIVEPTERTFEITIDGVIDQPAANEWKVYSEGWATQQGLSITFETTESGKLLLTLPVDADYALVGQWRDYFNTQHPDITYEVKEI